MSQICYVITNAAYPDWVKIGFTSKTEMKTRLQVYQTGSPFRDYEVFHEVKFKDARLAETLVKKQLKLMNATQANEWYKMPKKIAANMIDSILEDMEEDQN